MIAPANPNAPTNASVVQYDRLPLERFPLPRPNPAKAKLPELRHLAERILYARDAWEEEAAEHVAFEIRAAHRQIRERRTTKASRPLAIAIYVLHVTVDVQGDGTSQDLLDACDGFITDLRSLFHLRREPHVRDAESVLGYLGADSFEDAWDAIGEFYWD
ncbi:hypothetical protein Poly24_06580 [Rosistilla carotiformis]|uniref:Uncharacterized protein n=1 Tax=Rosistilla carotiformis TaxID=2528017 RepID=A0A518JN59_9BACT|nr:hypothetical protein [Rosistilla carotiformis]QDV66968.1 hypothetical protein Poly24_06580 [Rosistilla carotiformis]